MLIFLFGLFIGLINSVSYAAIADSSQFVCKAPTTQDNLCQTNDSFTPITEPDLDLGISNPVNLSNGTKLLKETDVPGTGNTALPFIRYYKSNNNQQKGFGISWTHNYAIQAKPDVNNKWRIEFPDGSTFISQNINESAGQIEWLAGQQRKFVFDNNGRLLALYRPDSKPIKLDYHQNDKYRGYLKTISNGTKSINFNYQTINKTVLVHSINTDLGNFTYGYHQSNLTKVTRPDGMWREYHFEPELQSGFNNLITGISIADQSGNNWRARSWQYDKQGRTIKAWPGKPSSPAIEFDYQANLTNIKSQYGTAKIKYKRIAGQNRISQHAINSPAYTINSHINYDVHGKIKNINGLNIERYASSNIKQLKLNQGWPDLQLNYTENGLLKFWTSNISNKTEFFYHADNGLQGIAYANGDRLDISPDMAKRPVKLHYSSNNSPQIDIDLDWHGQQLRRLHNNNETEHLSYDDRQNISTRAVIRNSFKPISYKEKFVYDNKDRLVQHTLPEGGLLIYEWLNNNIINIKWQDQNGELHDVIKTVTGLAGYAHGNGLHTQVLYGRHKSWLVLSQDNKPLWGEYRSNQPNGNLSNQIYLSDNKLFLNNIAYDDLNRTIAFQTYKNNLQQQNNWLAWTNDGRLLAKKNNKQSADGLIHRDTSGLPVKVTDFTIEYQAQRRLHKIRQGQNTIAEYAYNSRGQRIYQKYSNSSAHRLYVNNRLAAIWHISNNKIGKQQRFIYAHGLAVGLIETWPDQTSNLYYIHNNQLGAPVLLTDAAQNIVWQADYDIFGYANITINKIDMPLRLPGQDADPISGWHDNIFRTYLPEFGQYLEPDPLGPIPGQQAFGYAAQQPLRHTDPLGLVLLAFDGTRYDKSNLSNVWKMSQIYNDGPSFYHHGPGSSYYLNWDAVTAASSRQIQQNQWQSLLNVLDQARGQTVPIDILGYSRGAALARDFANKIVANTKNGWFSYDDPLRGNISVCVNLRFLGLFDTVAQFGILGAANAGYDLGIAGAWQWVAHAVAAHELRVLFPLVSTSENLNLNAIEVPFIGAHADIGGGMVLDDDLLPVLNGDLSDVALNWMYWQARAAMVNQKDLANDDRIVSQPWLHDERSPIEKSLLAGDRQIQDANTNNIGPQGSSTSIGNAQRQLFENFISRVNEHPYAKVTGLVDMQAYGLWLQEQLGMPALMN